MTTIIAATATNAEVAAAAAAVKHGTLIRYTYTYKGRSGNSRTYTNTGSVRGADGTMLIVTVVSHEEFPDYAGRTMMWSACFCEIITDA